MSIEKICFCTLLAACAAAPASAQTPMFPSDGYGWRPVTVGNVVIEDSNADTASTGGRNIVGADPVNQPSVLVAGFGDFLYFRLRVLDNPTSTITTWGCELDVDQNSSVYEYFVGYFAAAAAGTRVQTWFNGARTAGSSIEATTLKATHSESTFKLVKAATIGPTTNYWMSWAIPLADLNQSGFAVTATDPVALLCGTTADGHVHLTTSASGDIAGSTTYSDPFAAAVTNPPVVTTPADGAIVNLAWDLSIAGTAEAGAFVDVYLDDTPLDSTNADQNGAWILQLSSPPTSGLHAVNADAVGLGGPSGLSNTNYFSADFDAPPAATINSIASPTKLNQPTLSGGAEAFDNVEIDIDGSLLANVQADGAGNWQLAPAAPIADGTYTLSAFATDPAGNPQAASANSVLVTIDTMPPAAPIVMSPADGDTVYESDPAIIGTAEPSSTVFVTIDDAIDSALGTPVDGAGSWGWIPTVNLDDGVHAVKAFAQDAAGNPGADSNTNTFTVMAVIFADGFEPKP